MLKSKLMKTLAVALTTVCCCIPLTSVYAASKDNKAAQPQRQEQRIETNNKKDSGKPSANNKQAAPKNENKKQDVHRGAEPKAMRAPGPRVIEKQPEPKRPKRHPSSDGDLITGLVVGGIIGAVIANNT